LKGKESPKKMSRRRRRSEPHLNPNACWYTLITKKAVRENPSRFKAQDIGRYLVRESVDLFDAGQVVTKGDIQRQLAIWKTGHLSEEDRRAMLALATL
jgi:hypothetical protein